MATAPEKKDVAKLPVPSVNPAQYAPPELGKEFSSIGPKDGPRSYFKPVPGAWLIGELLGRYPRKGQEGKYQYQIKLSKPCPWAVAKDPESEDEDAKAEPVTVPAEAVLTIDERSALEDMRILAEDTAHRWEVFLQAIERVQLPGGNSVWRFKRDKRLLGNKVIPF